MTTEIDYITVRLSNDDYWRIRAALALAAEHHQRAADKATGHTQATTNAILRHEHIVRRLADVQEVLVEAFSKAEEAAEEAS